jgi:hypothetical protein
MTGQNSELDRKELIKENLDLYLREMFFTIQGEIDMQYSNARRFFAYIAMMNNFLSNLDEDKRQLIADSIYWNEVEAFYNRVVQRLSIALKHAENIARIAGELQELARKGDRQ